MNIDYKIVPYSFIFHIYQKIYSRVRHGISKLVHPPIKTCLPLLSLAYHSLGTSLVPVAGCLFLTGFPFLTGILFLTGLLFLLILSPARQGPRNSELCRLGVCLPYWDHRICSEVEEYLNNLRSNL